MGRNNAHANYSSLCQMHLQTLPNAMHTEFRWCSSSRDAHPTTNISTQITFWGASRPRGGSNDRNLVRIFGRGLLCPTRILRTISYIIDICPPDIYGIPISWYVSARDASPGRSRCTPWGKSRPHVSHTAHIATQSHNRITMQRYMSHTHSISYNRPTGPQACTHIFEKQSNQHIRIMGS